MLNCPAVLSTSIIRPMPVDHPQGQKAIRMVRAGTFESPAVSKQQQWAPGLSRHSLPPLCRYRQRTVHCSRHRNQEMSCKSFGETEEESGEKNIRQQNKKKKGKRNKGSNKNARSNLRADGRPWKHRRRSAKCIQPVPLKTACQAFGVHVYYIHQVV